MNKSYVSWDHAKILSLTGPLAVDDIMKFALSLPSSSQKYFLIVLLFSALAWCVWRQRNSICFERKSCSTGRTIIISILTTVVYWTGLGVENAELNQWLPSDPTLIYIPVQALPPNDETTHINIILSDHEDSASPA